MKAFIVKIENGLCVDQILVVASSMSDAAKIVEQRYEDAKIKKVESLGVEDIIINM